MRSRPTLGQVLRGVVEQGGSSTLRLAPHQWQVLRALARCRTHALGGQLFQCASCRRAHFVAHSCRNRHCPQCQGARALDWLEQQQSALLPIPYFHLVFTLPHVLNGLLRQNRSALLGLLFNAASQTLLEFGRGRLEAQLGITAVLHTWSQTLLDHYHLHCIVTGGGVALDGTRWVSSPAHYLFPVRALSRMFRGKFLAGLKALFETGDLEFHGQVAVLERPRAFAALLREAGAPDWVVYAKRPFAGPRQVLRYLSRYTHRVAISNQRLLWADAQQVAFTYKDYAEQARPRTMTLATDEFVRRFCLHILPSRFVKIRHYGLLGNRQRQQRLGRARELLGVRPPPPRPPDQRPVGKTSALAPGCCPFCGQAALILVREMAPPGAWRLVTPLDSS